MYLFNYKRLWLIRLPVVLIPACFFIFKLNTLWFGKRQGYFTGFIFYWLWCFLIPVTFIGWKEIGSLYSLRFPQIKKSKWLAAFLLILPLIFGYGFAFPKAIANAGSGIIVVSLLLAFVNAFLEELLWRGTFIKIFHANKFICIFYAGSSFGIWHLVPLSFSATHVPGGMISFIAFAVILGWLYGWIACCNKSIFWVTVSHVLLDFSGLGARIYFNLNLLLWKLWKRLKNGSSPTLYQTLFLLCV